MLGELPLDRILLETDAPWLAPRSPRKGAATIPAKMRFTVLRLAELQGVSPEEIVARTGDNAARLFSPRRALAARAGTDRRASQALPPSPSPGRRRPARAAGPPVRPPPSPGQETPEPELPGRPQHGPQDRRISARSGPPTG